jgi:5-oxoprolinase (ATP-hydrolysing) subunit B
MRVLPYGERAVLAEPGDLDAVLSLQRSLGAAPPAGVEEWVPAATTVLVRFDPSRTTTALVIDALRALPPVDAIASTASTVDLPVVYDGADLDDVAALVGRAHGEVVARHTAPTYTVAFCGFTPGFAYLAGGDPSLAVPRLATPRTRVPAGSVAIADVFTGVYPAATPGGWRLLGRTAAALWDPERSSPALLMPGTRVRFHAVDP